MSQYDLDRLELGPRAALALEYENKYHEVLVGEEWRV